MQSNWIGKSIGAEIDFSVVNRADKIKIFTTRPDTIFGATFIALSIDHNLTKKIVENNKGARTFIDECKNLNSDKIKIDKSKLTDKPICIIVGPEGDFSEVERDKILSFKGVQSVKINENILRSETAVISAISIVNYVIN